MLKKIFFNSKLPVAFDQFIFLYLFVWLAAFTCIREMVIHFCPIFSQFFGWVALNHQPVVIRVSTRATHAMATALVKELVDHAQGRFGEWRPRLPDRKVGPCNRWKQFQYDFR